MLSSNSPDVVLVNCDYSICQIWYKVRTLCMKSFPLCSKVYTSVTIVQSCAGKGHGLVVVCIDASVQQCQLCDVFPSIVLYHIWWYIHLHCYPHTLCVNAHWHFMLALLGGGVGVGGRVWIREQGKIKRRSKALLNLWPQTWTPLHWQISSVFLSLLSFFLSHFLSLFVGRSVLLLVFLSLSLPFSLPSSFSLSAQGEGARCFDAAEGIRSYSRDPWTAGKMMWWRLHSIVKW